MRYRKKPVVIEAYRPGVDEAPYPDWLNDALADGNVSMVSDAHTGKHLYADILTLEGVMRANHGDWIIRGVQGELYPCKHEIFTATYEPVEETA